MQPNLETTEIEFGVTEFDVKKSNLALYQH